MFNFGVARSSQRCVAAASLAQSSAFSSASALFVHAQRRAFSTPTLLLRQQHFQRREDAAPQQQEVVAEIITEDIVLENVEDATFSGSPAAAAAASSSSSSTSFSSSDPKFVHSSSQRQQQQQQQTTSASSSSSEVVFAECNSFDPYARAKITNFIKRMTGKAINDKAASIFTTRQSGDGVFRSQLLLPLPKQYGIRVAMGEAGSAKDAETLAAMHASNILDELGFQLYTLSSMQKKHATHVRATGRWAPMPEDAPRPFGTESPPPLRRGTGVTDESEGGIWQVLHLPASSGPQQLDSSSSASSSPSFCLHHPFVTPDHTLLSPFILDPGALSRVRALWKLTKGSGGPAAPTVPGEDDLPVQVRQEQKPLAADAETAAAANYFIAEILLGPYVAQGKAPDRLTATMLAAMHLELIFDAAGVPLFPYSKEKQDLHAQTATSFGRSAPRFGDPPAKQGSVTVPKPLKGIKLSKSKQQQQQQSSASFGDDVPVTAASTLSTGGQAWVSRHMSLLLSTPDAKFREVSAAEASTLLKKRRSKEDEAGDPVQELSAFLNTAGEPRTDMFLSIRMPDGRIRTSVVLPAVQGMMAPTSSLPDAGGSAGASSSSSSNNILGGVAEAANLHDSRILCAEHALDVLNTLGVMLHPGDQAQQAAHEKRRAARGKVVASQVESLMDLPQPLRLVGLNFSKQAESKSPLQQHQNSIDATEIPLPEEQQKHSQQQLGEPEQQQSQQQQHHHHQSHLPDQQQQQQQPQLTSSSATALDPNDEFIRKTQAPPHYWDLRPNSPDGFILVDPKPVAAAGITFSIASVRSLDASARDRIGAFAVHHGKTALDIVKTYAALTKENTVYFSTHIDLPVPVAEVGARTAIGEAWDLRHAEILASMHAELILDRLGLQLFPQDSAKQEQHAISARQLGRFAPMPSTSAHAGPVDDFVASTVTPQTPSPPPLRIRPLQAVVEVPREPVVGRGGEFMQVPMELYNSNDVLDLGAVMRVQFYLKRHRRTVVTPDVYCVPDTRCTNNMLHIAVIHVPMPAKYGRRTATGVALTRREAETLCYMHAERIIDAMGLALFPIESMQRRHLQAKGLPFTPKKTSSSSSGSNQSSSSSAAAAGAGAGDNVDDDVDPSTIVTPPALRLDPNAVVRPKQVPMLPERFFAASQTHDCYEGRMAMWRDYVSNADTYVDQVKKFDRAAKLAADRVPRTGDSLVDEALDEAESTELHREVRNHLMTYCLKMNVEYSQNWNTVQIGTATIRKSFTRVSVPGFPHIEALGIANNKETSMRKAAHHALALLKRLDPDFRIFETEFLIPERNVAGSGSSGVAASSASLKLLSSPASATRQTKSGKGGSGPDHGSYDRISGNFTTDGKIRLVNLYTLCNGLGPAVVSHREKIDERDGRKVQYTTVEVSDLNGSRIIGWAQEAGRKTNEPAAYDDLVNTLLKRVPQFGALARLLRTHPHLDPEHIVHLEIPPEQEKQLQELLQSEAERELQQQMNSNSNNNNISDIASSSSGDDVSAGAASSVRQHELQDESEAAATARRHADDLLLSTVDVATSSLLKRSRENAELDPQAAARLQAFLKAKSAARLASPEYQERFKARREKLTIFERRQELLDTIRVSPVTIVCVSTGGGKSTQVPQFILDDAIERGEGAKCTIVITQPRRISAMSIAQRVAAERLEKVGQSVGYTVRLDSKPGSNINFCTSGVLLRLLQSSPTIDHIKYLIIDEIHERDINSDFLLILLKQLVVKRSDLRVILMSATLQSELFSGFFGGAPVVNVEGFCHPVRELFLDDLAATVKERNLVTPSTKIFLEGKEEVATFENSAIGGADPAAASSSGGGDGSGNINSGVADHQISMSNNSREQQKATGYGTLEAPNEIDYPLIAFAIEHARKDFELHGGSILVFLPGWEEITRIRDMFAGSPNYHVLPLHSSVSAAEQLKCFEPPPDPATQVKLILSTNIAESGVTIDDIGCVIDLGRAKEKTYLSRRGRTAVGRKEMGTMSQLVQVLASRANVTQRRGRVGRTRPGVCMRLFSRRQFEELPAFATPEILRQPLDSLCLQIIALRLGDPLEFLSQALEPPPPQSIEAAMLRLFHLGAVTERRELSPLGLRLALLPVAPKVGKMILYGAALQCLDSALTLAACADVDPFTQQRELKDAVRNSKLEFSNDTLSDPITNVNAYNSWVNTKLTATSPARVAELESTRMLSHLSLTTISKYKEQYYEILRESGFLEQSVCPDQSSSPPAPTSAPAASTPDSSPSANGAVVAAADAADVSSSLVGDIVDATALSHTPTSTAPSSSMDEADSPMFQPYHPLFPKPFFAGNDLFLELSPFSRHADSLPLLKGLLCSGLFPNVALFRDKRRFRSKLQNMLYPFPASVASKVEEEDVASPFFVFDEMVKTAGDPRVFFRGVTNCSVWAILLLGASGSGHSHMEFRHDLNLALLDDWLVFRVTAETLEMIQSLKRKFLNCIERKFTAPADTENNTTLAKLQTIIRELVSLPLRPNDLTTNLWAERGELVAVDTKALVEELFREHGAPGSSVTAEELAEEQAARDKVTAETLEGAERLKVEQQQSDEVQATHRVARADEVEHS